MDNRRHNAWKAVLATFLTAIVLSGFWAVSNLYESRHPAITATIVVVASVAVFLLSLWTTLRGRERNSQAPPSADLPPDAPGG